MQLQFNSLNPMLHDSIGDNYSYVIIDGGNGEFLTSTMKIGQFNDLNWLPPTYSLEEAKAECQKWEDNPLF